MLAYFCARQGISHVARDGDARRRRAERDRSGAVRSARRAPHRGTAGRASLRRRRAVLPARDRLRLLVQHRGDAGEVGQPGDPRRLRPHDPHDSPRRHRRLRLRRRRRRAASPDVVALDARSVSRRCRSRGVPRSDCEGRPATVAGEEVLLHGRLRRTGRPGRRGGPGAPRDAVVREAAAEPADAAARPRRRSSPAKARRGRWRSATAASTTRCSAGPTTRSPAKRDHAQVPGHVAALLPLDRAASTRALSAARHRAHRRRQPRTSADVFDGVDTRITSLAGYAGRQSAGVAHRRRSSASPSPRPMRARRSQAAEARRPSRRSSAGSPRCASCARRSPSTGLSEAARYEIDFRLTPKERQFAEALLLASDVRLEALAADGLVVAGRRPCRSTLVVGRQSTDPRPVTKVGAPGLRERRDGCKTMLRRASGRAS